MKKTLRLISLLVALLTALTATTAMAACGHDDLTAPFEAGTRETYKQYSSTEHEVHWASKFVCRTCGDSFWMDWSMEWFPHEFSGDKCTKCGYTRGGSSSTSCNHNDASYHVSTTIGSLSYSRYTSSEHQVERHYRISCKVCGKVIDSDYVGRTPESHSFNTSGKCTKCGYNRNGTSTTTTTTSATPTPTPKPASGYSLSYTLTGSGTTRNIRITSSHRWTASVSDSWMTLNKNDGVNGETLQVTLSANPSTTSSRTGYVYLACGSTQTAVKIVQARSSTSSTTSRTGNTTLEIGDVVTFGHYEQDDNTANGKEPIKWVIMNKSDGYALLYAVNVLDVQPYNRSGHCDTWRDSSLRIWLNSDFLRSAFSASEQACLRTGKPFNNAHFTSNDQVFLLAYYGTATPLLNGHGLDGVFIDSNFRGGRYENVGLSAFEHAPATLYAMNKDYRGCEYYWELEGHAAENGGYGSFYTKNSTTPYGVRPAIWVKESALTPAE